MNKVCAKGDTVRGVDLYHGDQISDLNQVKLWATFAFLKAYENSMDPRFVSRWKLLSQVGITKGAYAFFHPGKDPLDQAAGFLAGVLPSYNKTDLPCVLDWESTDGVPGHQDKANALSWLHAVEGATKKIPIIYTSPYFAQALSLDIMFARYPLWIAHYGVKCPLVPAPWKTWTFWQNSESSIAVPGIYGHCDTDVFNGSTEELISFIEKSQVL